VRSKERYAEIMSGIEKLINVRRDRFGFCVCLCELIFGLMLFF
jgi:hypothetical protein